VATEKILIVGPAWIGDMVMAQTLFKTLRQQYPLAELHVLAPDWTRALLSRMPEINKAISLPFAHGELNLKKRWQLGRSLRQANYSQAIVLPNSFKSALIPFFAGIKKRIGWRGEFRYGLLSELRILNKTQYPLMIERFMALGVPSTQLLKKPYPLPQLIINHDSLQAVANKYQLQVDKPIIALCPGVAFGPSKRWPAEYFAEVAKSKLQEGYQIWLFGSLADKPLAEIIQAQNNKRCVDLCGGTSLAEAIDLLSLAKLIVTNDSGLMHIGAALHKPLIAIYGSTSADFTPPLGDRVKILNLNLACSPCFKRECPLGHLRCMKDLTPEQVITAIKEFI